MKLTEAVGLGSVQVVKNHPEWPNPYNGITAVRHGDIDRDIGTCQFIDLTLRETSSTSNLFSFCIYAGAYLAESEQRSCALAAATSVNGILCTAAGGYLIEQLPGADEETMSKVGQNLATLVEKDGGDTLPTNLLQRGVTPVEICEMILDGLGMQPLQQIEPKFGCQCSPDRLIRALRLLSKEDVDEILEHEEKVEARCEFCGKVYRMGPDEVRREMATQKGDPSKDSDFYES
jgi:molecular chaperone Hsp33